MVAKVILFKAFLDYQEHYQNYYQNDGTGILETTVQYMTVL